MIDASTDSMLNENADSMLNENDDSIDGGHDVPVAAGAGDTNICGGIIQFYWDNILGKCLDVNEQLRQTALKAITSFLSAYPFGVELCCCIGEWMHLFSLSCLERLYWLRRSCMRSLAITSLFILYPKVSQQHTVHKIWQHNIVRSYRV